MFTHSYKRGISIITVVKYSYVIPIFTHFYTFKLSILTPPPSIYPDVHIYARSYINK